MSDAPGAHGTRRFGDALLTGAVVFAACGVGVASLKMTFFPSESSQAPVSMPASVGAGESEQLPQAIWEEALAAGIRLGPEGAPLQVVEFVDFECRFCRRFHEAVSQLPDELEGQWALYLVHYPISSHRFALPAARAVECAHDLDRGRLPDFLDALFLGQDTFGLRDWEEFASIAGYEDLEAFSLCISRDESLPRVAAGIEVGDKIGITGTPTVLMNGWQIRPTPYELLAGVMDSVRAERGVFTSRAAGGE